MTKLFIFILWFLYKIHLRISTAENLKGMSRKKNDGIYHIIGLKGTVVNWVLPSLCLLEIKLNFTFELEKGYLIRNKEIEFLLQTQIFLTLYLQPDWLIWQNS